jgi:hypothetical protein
MVARGQCWGLWRVDLWKTHPRKKNLPVPAVRFVRVIPLVFRPPKPKVAGSIPAADIRDRSTSLGSLGCYSVTSAADLTARRPWMRKASRFPASKARRSDSRHRQKKPAVRTRGLFHALIPDCSSAIQAYEQHRQSTQPSQTDTQRRSVRVFRLPCEFFSGTLPLTFFSRACNLDPNS